MRSKGMDNLWKLCKGYIWMPLGVCHICPTLTTKQFTSGSLKGYWVRLGLYRIILVFEANEESVVWIDGIKDKRKMFIGINNASIKIELLLQIEK